MSSPVCQQNSTDMPQVHKHETHEISSEWSIRCAVIVSSEARNEALAYLIISLTYTTAPITQGTPPRAART